MKIPNYDPSLTAKSNYKQGHPCMPADTFRMLICGPSNSGKQNIFCICFTSCWPTTKFTFAQRTCIKTSTNT